jgi:hypothetical protein
MGDYPHAGTLPGGDDPVAARTSWEPLVGGGANFRTRNLVTVSSDRLEFPASLGMKAFGGVFALIGLVSVGVGATVGSWIAVLAGAIFAAVGIVLFRSGTSPVVFDKRHGAFWKGRTAPYETRRHGDLEHYAELAEVHALQILPEYVRGNKSAYTSYELNLVLRDGRRLNVVDHGDYESLRGHAETLSVFLDRPVWDAVRGQR